MPTKTEISNMAISHLGISKEIVNVDTENSQEARSVRRFYEIVRQATLRDFPWGFATKMVTLGLIESTPNNEWGYSYRYPSDCLQARRILSGIRNDSNDTRVVYRIGQDVTGRLIYTDQQNACLEYTVDETRTSILTPDFVLAFSFNLALHMVPQLTKGDPFGLRNSIREFYLSSLTMAQSNDANEDQHERHKESEFVRSRA